MSAHVKLIIFVLTLLAPTLGSAKNIFDSSIAELTNITITTASKTTEDIFNTPSASYVITSNDIERSGANILPEILRFVPGIEVAQISSNKWAVSARGFTDQLSNKLLVMIDGRSVYTPHFSGVYWEIQDTLLHDIDKIEITRGPGGSLWGANAVNGVINIITKKARDSQGMLVETGFGNQAQNITSARYGSRLADNIYYRSYAKYSKWDDLDQANDVEANDAWYMQRGGFRLDYEKSSLDLITIAGDFYDGNENKGRIATYPALATPFEIQTIDAKGGDVAGGNIMATWDKHHISGANSKIKFYYDNARRDYAVQAILRQTIDFELQNSFKANDKHNIVWGLGTRYHMERSDGSIYFAYQDDSKYYQIHNLFIQDKITLQPDKLFLTVGSKLEYNSFTDYEIQPSAKLAWHIDNSKMLWSSIARSVRMPSRSERDLNLVVGVSQGPPAGYIKWQGNKYMESEELIAYEIGYRSRLSDNASYDISAFYNDYDNLRTAESGSGLLMPLSNNGYGETYGVEVDVNFDPADNWRLQANYSFITLDLHINLGSTDTSLNSLEQNSPKNRFNIRSLYNITDNVEFDNSFYFVDNLASRNIPSYTRFDSRIAWRPIDGVKISLVGQNLFDDQHPEFTGALFSSAAQVGRSIFGKVTWSY